MDKKYILSLSYGKDSIACIEAIKQLGKPLNRIVHSEVWATQDINADLPPMVEFKKKADKIIKERYGIAVEHTCARKKDGSKKTYEDVFYSVPKRKYTDKYCDFGTPRGFPMTKGAWCNDRLKTRVLDSLGDLGGQLDIYGFPIRKENWCTSSLKTSGTNSHISTIKYLGIASDEPERIERHTKPGIELPLVEIGWNEAYCRKWCEENDLLSPIYTDAMRGGCWFCHNQSVDQLRKLYHNYPDLWALLLKWDNDSPMSFKSDGTTVHDYDKRFKMEDSGKIDKNKRFLWKMVRDCDK